MAFFSDLCHFTEGGADLKFRADRQFGEGDALAQDVLRERARVERDRHLFLHAVHALFGQKTHLTVPVAGVRIAHDAVVRTQVDPVDGMLLFALPFTDADRADRCLFSHSGSLLFFAIYRIRKKTY